MKKLFIYIVGIILMASCQYEDPVIQHDIEFIVWYTDNTVDTIQDSWTCKYDFICGVFIEGEANKLVAGFSYFDAIAVMSVRRELTRDVRRFEVLEYTVKTISEGYRKKL